MRKNVTFDSK
jgi:hypothetical protein